MTWRATATPSLGDLPAAHLDADGWPVLKPTLLTIHRTSPEDVKTRQVIMSLDGQKIATLLYGQAFRTATPLEKYINVPGVIVGNAELKPERGRTLDAQLFYTTARVADSEVRRRARRGDPLPLRQPRAAEPLLHAVHLRRGAALRHARTRRAAVALIGAIPHELG